MSEGHDLARAQIAKHGKDRYPTVARQYAKVLDEAGELAEALIDLADHRLPEFFEAAREEYADLGLAYYELGNKLGIDAIEAMRRLVERDKRTFT